MMLKSSLLAFMGLVLFMTSCTKEETVDPESLTQETVEEIEVETRSGQQGCYELVFPISIAFPDGTEVAYDDLESMKEGIKSYFAANPGTGRPKLVFPYEVINQEGEVITVENRAQMIQLRRECRFTMGNGPGDHTGKPCFIIVYPVTLTMPDGNEIEVDSRFQLKKVLRVWKKNNPDSDVRPTLNFPITIKLQDGTEVVVESKEDLKLIKEECRG